MAIEINPPDTLTDEIHKLEGKLNLANVTFKARQAGFIDDERMGAIAEELGVDFNSSWFVHDDRQREILFISNKHEVSEMAERAQKVIEIRRLIEYFQEAVRAAESSGATEKDILIEDFRDGIEKLRNQLNLLALQEKTS